MQAHTLGSQMCCKMSGYSPADILFKLELTAKTCWQTNSHF